MGVLLQHILPDVFAPYYIHPAMQPDLIVAPPEKDAICAEDNWVKLVQNCFVEVFANGVCLRVMRLAFGMFNTVDRKIQTIVVCFQLAAVFRGSVCQHTDAAQFFRGKERQNAFIKQIFRCDGRFDGIQFSGCPFCCVYQ